MKNLQANFSGATPGVVDAALVRILEAGGDGLAIFDGDMRYLYLNDAALRIVGKTREEMVGFLVTEIFPGFEQTTFWEAYNRSLRDEALLTIEDYFEPLDTWFDIRMIPHARLLYVHFRDITPMKKAEAGAQTANEALRTSEERLRETQTRLEAALSAGQIATCTIEVPTGRVSGDANLARLLALPPQAAEEMTLQSVFAAIHPDDRPRVMRYAATLFADPLQNEYYDEYRIQQPDGRARWVAARAKVERDEGGRALAIRGAVLEITERVEREQRERFLAELNTRTRALNDAEEVLYETARSVGEFTGADRCLYFEVDTDADTLTVRRDWVQNGVPSIVGVYPLNAFGPGIVNSLWEGNVTQSEDTETDLRIEPEHRVIFRALGFQSFLCVPLHKDGRWVGAIVLHQSRPRRWRAGDVDLLVPVAEQTWLAVENARLYRAMQDEIAERRAVAREQARFAALVENSSDFIGIVRLDGTGLYVNRAGRRLVGLGETDDISHLHVEEFFYPDDRPFILNEFYKQVERDGRGAVEVRFRNFATGEPIWVYYTAFSAPDPETGEVGALMTVTQDIRERKRREQEQERAQQRERNIATQLQEALQPAAPPNLPGLDLKEHYRPALDEAGVGGDFYDVYNLGAGRTALVVGDLAGKGLAAASQVATVRNMLRYALYQRYSDTPLGQTLADLNRTLARNNLLTGFATLFVGMYDSEARTLRYVNCGQEPGLLWRTATGEVEALPPTGPVLGGFVGGAFSERTVELEIGDVLAVFTDGMTEVGPKRAFLEVDGLSSLLARCCVTCEPSAAAIVRSLIAGVEAHAGGVSRLRDDIALLVGVATPSPRDPA